MAADDNVIDVKYGLLKMIVELNDTDRDSIEQWISSQSYKEELYKMKCMVKDNEQLKKICSAIKKIVPFEAEFKTENLVMPVVGDLANGDKVNTYHLDEFLYDDEEADKLVEKGKINRHYCVDCHSHNVDKLTFISHSMSRQDLQYIFKVLLPKDLKGKQILDVGSRIGAVLYAGYYISNASLVIGVEMNKECCEVQEKMISRFHMDSNRIKVIHSDIIERMDIVQNSDVIVINVLDRFVSVEKQRRIWYFLNKHMKKGSYLVVNRSIEETLSSLDIYEEFMSWLNICRPFQLENELLFDLEYVESRNLVLYIVN